MKQFGRGIIFDLDSTLFDPSKRLHHIVNDDGSKKKDRDYESFYAACGEDEVIPVWAGLLRATCHYFQANPLFVTGRPNRVRDQTHRALRSAFVGDGYLISSGLFMRPDDDKRPAEVMKKDLYETHIAPNYEIIFAIDDSVEVCKMWASLGIPVLICGTENNPFRL